MTTIEAGTFAEACFNQNSLHELNEALAQEGADDTDCNTWGISPEEWRESIKAALASKAEAALESAIKHHESISDARPCRATGGDLDFDGGGAAVAVGVCARWC